MPPPFILHTSTTRDRNSQGKQRLATAYSLGNLRKQYFHQTVTYTRLSTTMANNQDNKYMAYWWKTQQDKPMEQVPTPNPYKHYLPTSAPRYTNKEGKYEFPVCEKVVGTDQIALEVHVVFEHPNEPKLNL
jgi:hypothetical protein